MEILRTYVVYVPIIVQNQLDDGVLQLCFDSNNFRIVCYAITLCKIAKTVFHPQKWILAHFSEIVEYITVVGFYETTYWSNCVVYYILIKKNWGAKYVPDLDFKRGLLPIIVSKGTTKHKK